MKTLTEEQSRLVEENHNLIYEFAHRKKLQLDDYYDVLAIGLCNAALVYDETKSKFSTIAFYCMENELNMCWRRMTKKSAIPNKLLLSYDSQMYDNEMEKMSFVTQLVDEKLHENMIGNAIASFLIDLLNEKEKTIVQSLVYGLTQNEIAEQLKCKQQNISYFVSQIKKKWTPYLAG